MYLSALFLATAAASGGAEIYTVDLGRVVSVTDKGKSIGAELGRLHQKAEKEIRAEEDRIAARRKKLGPEGYKKALDRLATKIGNTEQALGAKQDELLAPELTRVRALMTVAEKKAGGAIQIVEKSEVPMVGAPRACDLTAWLSKTAKGGAMTAPPRDAACRFRHFFYVGFDEALAAMNTAAEAKGRLDQLKERYQSELDKWQKQLREIRQKAETTKDPKWEKEHLRLSREVEQKFSRLQKQLEQRELDEQGQLYATIEATLSRLSSQVRGVAFVEKLKGANTSLSPSCDITTFIAALLNGEADLKDLKAACPSYRPPEKSVKTK